MRKLSTMPVFGGAAVVILLIVLTAGIGWATEAEDEYMTAYTGAEADAVGTDMCVMCHADMAPGDDANHAAALEVEDGEYAGTGCEGCHGPGGSHNGVAAGILLPTLMPQADVTELCTKCHEETDAFSLESWGEGRHNGGGCSCVTCHSGHSPSVAFIVGTDAVELCGTCHEDEVAAFNNNEHGTADMGCEACHNPHD